MFSLYHGSTFPIAPPVLGCDEDHAQLDQIPIPTGLWIFQWELYRKMMENDDPGQQPWTEMRFPLYAALIARNPIVLT